MTTDRQPNLLNYDLEASIRRAQEPFPPGSGSVTVEPVSSTPAEPLCWARYPSTDRTARIVHCDLPAGHDGDHEETDTESTWPADPYDLPRIAPRRIPTPVAERERAAYERGKAEGIPAPVREAAGRLRSDIREAIEVLYGDLAGEDDTAEDAAANERAIASDMATVLDWITGEAA